MKRTFLYQAPVFLFLLFISLFARGQTPYVGGLPNVCVGSQYVYNVTYPTAGLTYIWSVTSQGNIVLTSTNTATVYWGIPGSATVTATGKNAQGTTIETLTLGVMVNDLPEPQIGSSFPIACKPLKYYPLDVAPEFDTSECLTSCANSGANYFSIVPFGNGLSWTATGGTITSSNINSVSILWGNPGKGTVTVTETNSAGCKGSKTVCVDLVPSPIAHFVSLPDTTLRNIHICEGSTVMFIDKSQTSGGSPIVSWQWDFGDGTYSSAPGGTMTPVSHTYNTPGHYTVTLTVTNACGCTSYETMDVEVDQGPGVTISCPGVVCEGATAAYSVDVPCNPSSWSVQGGTTMGIPTAGVVSVQWNATPDGFGYVMYDPSACAGTCPAVTVVKIPIVDAAHAIEGEIVICPNGEYIYRLPQWPSTEFTWTLGGTPGIATLEATDQPNEIVIKTGNSGGSIILRCNYENTLLGCIGSTTLNIDVLNPETITGDKKVCLNTTGNSYSLAGGNSGNWTLTYPDQTTTINSTGSTFTTGGLPFDQVGQYKLEVTGTGFCPPEAFYIIVDPLPPTPTSIDGPDTICKGVPVQFAGNPELSSSVLRWDMQNGTVNAAQGPFSFIKLDVNSNGPFVISLWRESKELPYCHSDTITKLIDTPFIKPVVSGDTTPCIDTYEPYTVDFTDGESYNWRIYPETMGSVESGQNTPNVSVLWNHLPDTAWVICEVRKCFSVFRDSLMVEVSPAVKLGGAYTISGSFPSCPGWGLSIDLNAGVTTSTWDFGDGSPVVTVNGGTAGHAWDNVYGAQDPVIIFVTVTATNSSGCPNNLGPVQIPVFLDRAPLTTITPGTIPCEPSLPFSNTLTANYNPAYPQPQWYEWYHNGVKVAEGATLSSYPAIAYGEYYVIAYKANNGTAGTDCRDTSTNKVKIVPCGGTGGCGLTPLPLVSLSHTPPVAGVNDTCGYVELTATHTTPNWIISNWIVSSPNDLKNSITTATSGKFWFKKAGVYTITYRGVYSDGLTLCEVDDQVTVLVPYIPDIDFTAYCDLDVANNRHIQLAHKGSTFAVNATWMYAFDNNIFNVNPIDQLYVSPGLHSVGIQMNSYWPAPTYPTCTYFETINVPNLPQANFVTDRPITCEKEAPVVFTNTSTNASTAFWDFADGAQNTQYDPERVFELAGPYDVTLTATDIFGCTDNITKTVTIQPDRIDGKTVHSPTNPCDGTPVTLSYSPNAPAFPNFGNLYKWKTNNSIFAIGTLPSTTVFKSGYYWVYTEDQYGCWDEAAADTVNIVQVPKVSIFGKHDACVDAEFTLSGYAGSIPGAIYQWYDNNGAIFGATSATLSQTIATPGSINYQVSLTVPKPGGGSCTRFSPLFTVDVHGNPTAPAPSFSVLLCSPYFMELNVSPQPAGIYQWSNGSSGLPASVSEGGPYRVTYIDQYGCQTDTSLMTPKHPSAYLWMFPSGCYNLCNGATYKVVGPIIPFSKWTYLQNGGIWSIGSGIVPPVTISTSGVYNLELNNGYCIALSDPMNVDFYGCDPSPKRNESENGGQRAGEWKDLLTDEAVLDIVPNPAHNSTRIDFALPGNGEHYTLEVYDALGRKLNSLAPPVNKGSWYLPLDGYAPGVYQVVLREENRVLLQKRLSVTR